MAEPSTGLRSKTRERRCTCFTHFINFCEQHKRPRKAPGVRESIIAIIKTSWLNVLLIFIPLSWIFHFFKLSDTLVFVFSLLAIVPLAKLFAFATDELSLRFGQTLAGLLNATFGNAVELIVSIIALVKCELSIVQSSLVGSILSNLLLVLGMCFFAGGTRFWEQGFGISAVQLNASLLTSSVIAVLLPAAFHNAVQPSDSVDPLTHQQEGHGISSISHSAAAILLLIYICYLVLFDDHLSYPKNGARRLHISEKKTPFSSSPPPTVGVMDPDQRSTRSLEAGLEEEEFKMGLQTTLILLIVVTVLIFITAEFLSLTGHISKGFVGLILLPIVGNSARHATAITVSVDNKITPPPKIR